MSDEIDGILDRLTRDFLRPALAAAAVEDVERYEVTWVREDGFQPGIFQQEGDGTYAVGYSCPPWPELFEGPFYQVAGDSVGAGKPCRSIYCARHYGDVADAECTNAYHCPTDDE